MRGGCTHRLNAGGQARIRERAEGDRVVRRGGRGGIRVALVGAGGVAPERARGTDATGAANARRPCCNQCVVKYSPPATQNTGACSHWHGRRAEVLVVRVAVWVGPAGRRGERVIAV